MALALGAAAVCLLVLEFVVFRYILVPDDLLPNKTIDTVVRYEPNRRATFRYPDGSETRVTINAQGWNSRHNRYEVAKPDGTRRVAVIGDSYVHNKFVNPEQSFTALLEDKLTASGETAQVYRFGMDGAPLSQYLHVLRTEVLKYDPDVVVIPLIHNDFDEMYRGIKTRYASSFMKLRKSDCGTVVEIPPSTFRPGLADKLRRFATFRYLYYETNLYLYAKRWINALYWGGNEDWDPAFVSSAVDIRKINDHEANRFFARYVMREFQKLSAEHGFKLLFIMDGVRDAIYERREPMDYEVGRLNKIAREVTGEFGIPFVDLHEAFAADYAVYGKRFEFPYDWHWNMRANQLIADVLKGKVTELLTLPERSAFRSSGVSRVSDGLTSGQAACGSPIGKEKGAAVTMC
jgi:hypothetical protein